mmetsp:Transcript_53946/g.117734  ORF Transcript_53946/g.117734 Transcript_53946/m.117734 type:complete len:178 (-) Transcript_53946:8-541(-)
MAGNRLPVRVVRETLNTGCSKRRSHRMLPAFQQFEIPHQFPKFPQIFGEWIVRRIKKKETGSVRDHPCSKAYDAFLDCARRHPNTYEKKCRIEAGKCLSCLEDNQGWKAPEAFGYMRLLEHFKVFSEGRQSHDEGPGKFIYRKEHPRTQGVGTVMQFGGSTKPGPPGGRGGRGGFGS